MSNKIRILKLENALKKSTRFKTIQSDLQQNKIIRSN